MLRAAFSLVGEPSSRAIASDYTAKDLAAWAEVGRKLVGALPHPVTKGPMRHLLLVLCLVGCSSRAEALHTSLVALDAAQSGFLAYDAAHQAQLVDAGSDGASVRASLAAYRAARDKATGPTGLLTTAWRALAVAEDLNDAPSLQTAEAAVAQVVAIVKTFTGGGK